MFDKKFLRILSVLTLFFFINFSFSCATTPKITSTEKDKSQEKEKDGMRKGKMVILKPGEKKKKKFPWILAIGGIVVIGVVFFLLPKKGKILTVEKGEGVDGYRESGNYKFKKGKKVNYSYALQTGYSNLKVALDGQPIPSSGTITMNGNHTLTASAEKSVGLTDVEIKFTVTFGGLNLKVTNNIEVDEELKMQETIRLNDHCYGTWQNIDKIRKTFTFTRGLGEMTIRNEIMDCSKFYNAECDVFEDIEFKLEVINYNYAGGPDPGKPSLSESEFYFRIDPWCNENGNECDKTKTITIIQ